MGGSQTPPAGSKKLIINQAPTGIIWFAVPFSCFFNVVKTQRVAAEQLQEGTKWFRMGEIPFIHLSTPSIHPSSGKKDQLTGLDGQLEGLQGQLEGLRGQLEGSKGSQEGSKGQLVGSEGQPAVSKGQPAGSEGQLEGSEGQLRVMDKWMDKRNFSPFYRTLT